MFLVAYTRKLKKLRRINGASATYDFFITIDVSCEKPFFISDSTALSFKKNFVDFGLADNGKIFSV